MKKSDLLAFLGLLGINELPEGLDGLLFGDGFAEPEKEAMTYEAGRIVAAWRSIHAGDVEVSVVAPDGKSCRTRYGHPGAGDKGTNGELWDLLQITLSGTAARMAVHGKIRGGDCAFDLGAAKALGMRITARQPFQAQPWDDTPRIGKFTVSRIYAERPQILVAHAIDTAYRYARLHAERRAGDIRLVADMLRDKKLLLGDDIKKALGERTFALNRR